VDLSCVHVGQHQGTAAPKSIGRKIRNRWLPSTERGSVIGAATTATSVFTCHPWSAVTITHRLRPGEHTGVARPQEELPRITNDQLLRRSFRPALALRGQKYYLR